jgi:NAD(P)-dependent dehydrogenase (short-subunit alcohol dehydrogenase family)
MGASQPTAIIFGANGRVAQALAAILSRNEWNLALTARSAIEEHRHFAGRYLRCVCDVTVPTQVDEVIAQTTSHFGALDAVVNCAGSILLKPGHLIADEEWDQVILTNLTSSFYILRSAVRNMSRSGGSVTFVSTAAARTGIANHEAISAAKSGIEGLVRSAAATYAPRGIRVNAVAPGLVRSHMTKHLTENEGMLASSTAMHALGRIGEPGDVARALAWLMDPIQSWITGQIIGVDGGLAHLRPRVTARVAAAQAPAVS